jgi:ribose transport system substrate-binding protein
MQLADLLPQGGKVLYIVGPNTDSVAQQRSNGMTGSKPGNIQLLVMRGNWTVESGHDAVSSWWKLSTSRQQPIVAVAAQNDAMAFGAKQALQELSDEHLANAIVIGCDELPESGQAWVKRGLPKATVVVPVLAGIAVEMLLKAIIEKKSLPKQTVVAPKSYPSLSEPRHHDDRC